MNPWLITSWIGAICVSALIISATIAGIHGLLKPSKSKTVKIQ